MIKNQEGRQEVYLALRNIFKDQHVQLRKRKRIRNLIQIQPQERAVQQVLHKYGLDVVVSTARVLLADGIFESDIKAQSLFPDVFKLLRQENADEGASDTATLDPDHKTNLPPDERRLGGMTWSDGCGKCSVTTHKILHQVARASRLIVEQKVKAEAHRHFAMKPTVVIRRPLSALWGHSMT